MPKYVFNIKSFTKDALDEGMEEFFEDSPEMSYSSEHILTPYR